MAGDDFDPFGLKNDRTKQQIRPELVNVSINKGENTGALDSSLFDPFGITIQSDDNDFFDEVDSTRFPINQVDMDGAFDNVSNDSPTDPPLVSRITRVAASSLSKGITTVSLPPKLTVKLKIHEEASTMALQNKEGASDVIVEGIISAQVQCSDAKRNAPFCLEAVEGHDKSLVIHPNRTFSPHCEDIDQNSTKQSNYVAIPKHEIGYIPIATYSMSSIVQHMPLLLERKITITGSSCRVAVQVRSKLSNVGDISQFSVAVAVPEYVDVQSVQIVRGDGVWDELKRTIKWNRSFLKRGESFMVSAQAELLDGFNKDELQFPVMLRCLSTTDKISNVEFRVVKNESHPSSVTCHKAYSFLLLHRLP